MLSRYMSASIVSSNIESKFVLVIGFGKSKECPVVQYLDYSWKFHQALKYIEPKPRNLRQLCIL